MLDNLLSSCSISLHLLNQVVFLRPSSLPLPSRPDDPSLLSAPCENVSGSLLRGFVEVRVPSARKLGGVRVRIRGVSSVALPALVSVADPSSRGEARLQVGDISRYEERVVLDESVETADNGVSLDAGTHVFAFSFPLAAHMPPYERSRFGRVRYVCSAVARGAGYAKTDVSAWKEVFVTCNPSPAGVNGLNALEVLHTESYHGLGVLRLAMLSPSLSVSGSLLLHIRLEARLVVEQTFELRSRNSKETMKLPAERRVVWSAGARPPLSRDSRVLPWAEEKESAVQPIWRHDEEGDTGDGSVAASAWETKAMVRLPSDDKIRPSTSPGTMTDIRVGHELVCEIFYSVGGGGESRERGEKLNVFTLRKKVVIPSCCVSLFDLELPSYEAATSATKARPPSLSSYRARDGTPIGSSSASAQPTVCTMSVLHGILHPVGGSNRSSLSLSSSVDLPRLPHLGPCLRAPETCGTADEPWPCYSVVPVADPTGLLSLGAGGKDEWPTPRCVCGMRLSTLSAREAAVLDGLGIDFDGPGGLGRPRGDGGRGGGAVESGGPECGKGQG